MEDKTRKIIKKEFGADVLDIKSASGGFSHKMFEVKINKEPSVLLVRFSNNSEEKDKDLRKEIFVYEEMRKIGIPVPKVFAFRKNDGKGEHDYMILEKLTGIRLDTIWDGLSEEEKIDLTVKIGKLMKKIHTISLDKFGRLKENGEIEVDTPFKFKESGVQLPHNPFLRQFYKDTFKDIARLLSYDHINPQTVLNFINFMAKNKELMRYTGKPILIHGDMMPGHIFVEKIDGEYKITGLIDVEFAEPSCPEYDFIKLHRQGFFDNPKLKRALEKGYGKINEKIVLIFRITRDMAFSQVLFESGNNEKAKEVLKSVEERLDKYKD